MQLEIVANKYWLGVVFILLLSAISTIALAQNNDNAIESQKNNYEIGKFSECIKTIRQCLDSNRYKKYDERVEAYRIIAESYLAIDSVETGEKYIDLLLTLKEDFEPNFDDPERFKKAFERVRLKPRNDIVSSVSKTNEPLQLAPATTMVITQEQIMQRGYKDIIEVLKDLPAFDISLDYGSPDASIGMRGFKSETADKILILVDGVEDNDLRSYIADVSQQYPMFEIKRIEVIYGPSSTMYGTNAFSGVINIVTKKAEDFFHKGRSFGMSANAGIGAFNTKFAEMNMGFKKGKFSIALSGRVYESDRTDLSSQLFWDYDPAIFDSVDYSQYLAINDSSSADAFNAVYGGTKDTVYFKYNKSKHKIKSTPLSDSLASLYDKAAYNQTFNGVPVSSFINKTRSFYLDAKINMGDLSFGLVSWQKDEGSGTKGQDQGLSVSGTVARPLHNYLYFNYHKYFNDNKMLFTALMNYRINTLNNGSCNLNLYSYKNESLGLENIINQDTAYWVPNYYFVKSKQFRSEFRINYIPNPVNPVFTLLSGLEFRNSELPKYILTSQTSAVPEEYGTYAYSEDSSGGNQLSVNDIGLYSQARWRKKRLGFTLGGRMDYNAIRQSDGLGLTFSPRAVIDYSYREWIFKAIFSKGIEGVSNANKYNTTNKLVPNPTLKTQSIYNFELSAYKKINEKMNFDIDFYYSKVNDVVGRVLDSPRIFKNINIGDFSIYGLQASYTYSFKSLTATINYSYTNAKQTMGDTSTRTIAGVDSSFDLAPTNTQSGTIAPNKANAIINYTIIKTRQTTLNINVRANYEGDKFLVNSKADSTVPAFVVSNMALTASNKKIFPGGTIQLVCNNVFNKEYFDSRSYGIAIIPQPRRNFLFRILYEF